MGLVQEGGYEAVLLQIFWVVGFGRLVWGWSWMSLSEPLYMALVPLMMMNEAR